jgi:hypothetical protein
MSTFSEMVSEIADDLGRTDLTSQIKEAINRAIKHYEKERFYFNETTNTLTTLANQQAYGTADGLPSTIKEIDVIKLTLSATNKPELEKRSYHYIQSMDIANLSSQPTDYAWYQSKLYLYPIPDSVYTLTISHQKSYTALSADSDENDWTTEAEDLIEAHAKWWLYKKKILDKEKADEAVEDEQIALAALREKSRKLMSIGRLTPTSF